MIRRSKRPNKQLLWFWMSEIFQKSEGCKVGIDVACGRMLMCKYIRTKEYIGIDADGESIDEGLKNHPKAKGVVASIEQMDKSISGDFVVCLQTIGINKYFKPANTIHCIENLVQATNGGGGACIQYRAKSG